MGFSCTTCPCERILCSRMSDSLNKVVLEMNEVAGKDGSFNVEFMSGIIF